MIGAMLMMGFMLAFAEMAIEFTFVLSLTPEKFQVAKYDRFLDGTWSGKMKHRMAIAVMSRVYKLGPWLEASRMHSMIFSLVVSLMLGALFPVAGIIAAFAAITSTVLGQPVYSLLNLQRRYKAWREQGNTLGALVRSKCKDLAMIPVNRVKARMTRS